MRIRVSLLISIPVRREVEDIPRSQFCDNRRSVFEFGESFVVRIFYFHLKYCE